MSSMHRASDIPELKVWADAPLYLSKVKKLVRQAWKRFYGDICQLCGCRMHFEAKFRSNRHYATIDHILARALGGKDSLDNIQCVCFSCNNNKSADEYHKMPVDEQ